MVSMLGNLALMRLLVDAAHLPLLVSNGVAILCCSILNFFLGDTWAFAAKGTAIHEQAGDEGKM
jgi:putative flippase GtrA